MKVPDLSEGLHLKPLGTLPNTCADPGANGQSDPGRAVSLPPYYIQKLPQPLTQLPRQRLLQTTACTAPAQQMSLQSCLQYHLILLAHVHFILRAGQLCLLSDSFMSVILIEYRNRNSMERDEVGV